MQTYVCEDCAKEIEPADVPSYFDNARCLACESEMFRGMSEPLRSTSKDTVGRYEESLCRV